MIINQQTILSV